MAVNRFTNGAGGNTWNTAGNWSQGTVPTLTDGHVTTFDATSPNCTMGAARSCNNIDFTGYTNTLTMSTFLLTVGGNITLDTGMLISGTGGLTVNSIATTSLDFNGFVWPNNFTLTRAGAAVTATLLSDIEVNGLFTCSSGSTCTIDSTLSETVICNGGMNLTAGTTGTAKIILKGGTWTGSAGADFSNNLDIDGTCTVSGNVNKKGGTVTHLSGTVTTTGSTIHFVQGSTTTLNTSGITWNNVTIGSAGTSNVLTLTSNLNIAGLLYAFTVTCTINATASETVTVAGGITCLAKLTGTAKVIMTGGTWSTTGANGIIENNLDLDGTITVSGTVYYQTGTLKRVSGTITTTSSTLHLCPTDTAVTLETTSVTWNNVSLPVTTTTRTLTINALFSISSTFTLSQGTLTFNGTAGWSCATLIHTGTSSVTITLKESITYTITALFQAHTTAVGSILLFTSAHASTRANLVMPNNGNNLCNVLASFTRIDASGGRSICTFAGTVTDCINVNQFYDYKGVAL